MIAQINQTEIGDNERSDEDLIAAVNKTDIDVDNSDIVKAVNNTHMGNIPPNVSKINSISNEEEDVIQDTDSFKIFLHLPKSQHFFSNLNFNGSNLHIRYDKLPGTS